MADIMLESLESRFDRLQSENRKLNRGMRQLKLLFGGLALAVLLPLTLGAYDIPEVIAAKKFVVVDPQTNKPRITLGTSPQGTTYILVEDAEGKDHIAITADWKGEMDTIDFFDIDGNKKVSIGTAKDTQGLWVNGKVFP